MISFFHEMIDPSYSLEMYLMATQNCLIIVLDILSHFRMWEREVHEWN